MAKTTIIVADGISLLNANQRIDWTKFKNTPSSLVSGTGHDHDTTYYLTEIIDDLFDQQLLRLETLEAQVETLAYKNDLFMGGGGDTSNTVIDNYNILTEVFSTISTTLINSTLNAPGISVQRSGYFFNGLKTADKFDNYTLSVETIANPPINIKGTIIDFAIQSKGFATNGIDNWVYLNTTLDTWTMKPIALSDSSNQVMLSAMVKGFSKGAGDTILREYIHSSGVNRDIISFNTVGDTVGLCKSSTRGFWLSTMGYNYISDYVTDTITSLSVLVFNTAGASTCTSQNFGVIGSGSHNTNVQKLTWSTLAISLMTEFTNDKTGASSLEG